MGKTVTNFLKPDIISSVGPLQLAAGMEGGCEAAVHAMTSLFESDDCDGILLVDATNAFNSLHRSTALHNIRFICPEFATYIYIINTYIYIYIGSQLNYFSRTAHIFLVTKVLPRVITVLQASTL